MTSPEEYNHQISKLSTEHDDLEKASSISEAKDNIIRLQEIERDLLFIEQRIKESMVTIPIPPRKRSNSSFLSTLFRQSKHKQADADDGKIKDQHEAYKLELTYANAVRSVTGQVTIPNLKNFISKNERASSEPINYFDYIKSTEWRKKAEEVKAQAGNRCQVCNRSRAEVQLEAHHRTYERLGDERPEDITILCRDCHQLYEAEKKQNQSDKLCKKCSKSFVPLNSSHRYCMTCFIDMKRQRQNDNQDIQKIVHSSNGSKSGFCIRCREEIKLDPKVPYCYSCYKIWMKYENQGYQEKSCHICGNENESTMLKPVCLTCYRKHHDELEFHS